MPVTSFALLVCSVIAAAALTVWAVGAWGVLTVLSGLLVLIVVARWAFAHVPYDDPSA